MKRSVAETQRKADEILARLGSHPRRQRPRRLNAIEEVGDRMIHAASGTWSQTTKVAPMIAATTAKAAIMIGLGALSIGCKIFNELTTSSKDRR